MNIEHFDLLSWFHERHERQLIKPCARLPDAGRNARSASGDPAMVLTCWMASSFRFGAGLKLLSLWPRATGTLPVIVQSPECCWTNVYLASTLSTKTFRSSRPEADLRRLASVCEWLAEKH